MAYQVTAKYKHPDGKKLPPFLQLVDSFKTEMHLHDINFVKHKYKFKVGRLYTVIDVSPWNFTGTIEKSCKVIARTDEFALVCFEGEEVSFGVENFYYVGHLALKN